MVVTIDNEKNLDQSSTKLVNQSLVWEYRLGKSVLALSIFLYLGDKFELKADSLCSVYYKTYSKLA